MRYPGITKDALRMCGVYLTPDNYIDYDKMREYELKKSPIKYRERSEVKEDSNYRNFL